MLPFFQRALITPKPKIAGLFASFSSFNEPPIFCHSSAQFLLGYRMHAKNMMSCGLKSATLTTNLNNWNLLVLADQFLWNLQMRLLKPSKPYHCAGCNDYWHGRLSSLWNLLGNIKGEYTEQQRLASHWLNCHITLAATSSNQWWCDVIHNWWWRSYTLHIEWDHVDRQQKFLPAEQHWNSRCCQGCWGPSLLSRSRKEPSVPWCPRFQHQCKWSLLPAFCLPPGRLQTGKQSAMAVAQEYVALAKQGILDDFNCTCMVVDGLT